jgi:hypothetical protein
MECVAELLGGLVMSEQGDAGDRDARADLPDGGLDARGVSPAFNAVIAALLGGEVERVTDAIVQAGDPAWFSAVWAWARMVIELAGGDSAPLDPVPLGIWIGRHLGPREASDTVAAIITAALGGRPELLRHCWSALGVDIQQQCGMTLLGLATAASRQAIEGKSGRGDGCR